MFFIKLYLSVYIILTTFSSFDQRKKEVELWDFDQLSAYLSHQNSEKLKVVNFWATWCAPCIKEMPYFDEVHVNYKDDVEVTLVSLDFSDELNKKVIPLLERKGIKSKVVLMTDEKYNEWIDKVDKSWSGALPATMFITPEGKHIFHEQEFERDELITLIEDLKPKNN